LGAAGLLSGFGAAVWLAFGALSFGALSLGAAALLSGLGAAVWLGFGALSFGALSLGAAALLSGLGAVVWLGFGALSLAVGRASACDSPGAALFGSRASLEACELGVEGLAG
jgi:hypothetical protein